MSVPLRLTAVISLVLAALVPAASSASGASACASKPTYIHAFNVDAEWTKKSYRRGEKAEVTVTVTRPAHEDPADLGVPIEPPVSVPVEGVIVWTSVDTGSYPYPFGYGVTDAQGEVRFKIKTKGLSPGPWAVSHSAEKATNQGGCPDIIEWGYLYESPAFAVTP